MTAAAVPLRRADWRYLLPGPPPGGFKHLVLLGGPRGLGERLSEVGFARQVTARLPSARSADAVVVLDDAKVELDGAARCVANGGVFYCEVDRRGLGGLLRTPTRVQETLQGAGLSVIATYWALPDFERARRYLPLDSSEVLHWYFSTLQTVGSPWAAGVDVVTRMLVQGGPRRLGRWVPCFAVAAVASDGVTAPPSVLAHAAAPSGLRRPGVHTALLTSGVDDGSRVVVLPFAPGRAEPTIVIKVARLPAFNRHTEREQLTLTRLRARLDADLRETIPEPLGTYHYGDAVVAMERCVEGPSLVVSSGRWGGTIAQAVDDLDVATTWVTRFHQQTRSAAGSWEAGPAAMVDGRLEEYRRRYDATSAEARLLSLALERSAALRSAPVPTVLLHNDYGPWHIHRSGSRVTVIDWEFGGAGELDRTGPPLCDLLYFVTHWYFRVRHLRTAAAELRGIHELFVQPAAARGRAAQAAHLSIGDYLTRLDIDVGFYPLLLTYTWVDRALDRAERGRVEAKEGAIPTHSQYDRYVRVLAEGADRVFVAPGPR